MKTFIVRFVLGLVIAVPLVGVVAASAAPGQIQNLAISVGASIMDVPSPSPTPVVGSGTTQPAPIEASPVVQPSPDVPNPGQPQEFPSPTPHLEVPTPGATPTTVTPPQANVFIGVTCDSSCKNDVNTGGVIGPAPLTLTWHGTFQGGFDGVTPTFIWSDGHIGPDDTVTYTTPGTLHGPSVKVQQVYNGVTYEVAAANPNVPFTVY